MQTFVVVTEDETIRVVADWFNEEINGKIFFYVGAGDDDPQSVAFFRAGDVKRIYVDQPAPTRT